jgi:Predicted pPIWI-associating nuclease
VPPMPIPPDRMNELASLARDLAREVPTGSSNVKPFSHKLRGLLQFCLNGAQLSQEVKDAVPVERSGELYVALDSLKTWGASAWTQSAVKAIQANLATVAEILQQVNRRSSDNAAPATQGSDADLVKALDEMVGPAVAACYRQAIADLAAPGRESFVGPAAELREVFTAVIHKLAPDDLVFAQPDWKPETENGRPTRRQRVQFILKKKRTVGEEAVRQIDGLDRIANDLYARASKLHLAGVEGPEVFTISSYLHGLLRDLLLPQD